MLIGEERFFDDALRWLRLSVIHEAAGQHDSEEHADEDGEKGFYFSSVHDEFDAHRERRLLAVARSGTVGTTQC